MRSNKYVYERKRPKRKSKKKRGFGRFIFLVVLIVFVVVGGAVTLKILTDAGYDDEKSFIKYSEKYFSENQESDKLGKAKTEFEYGQPFSTAYNYPVVENKIVDTQIDEILENANIDFYGRYENASPEAKIAFLTNYDSYESSKNTGSVVLKSALLEENDKGKLIKKDEKVNVITFSLEHGSGIYPMMAFNSGYRDKLTDFFKNYLSENYKDQLTKKWKNFITTDNSYENFALTKDGAIFYFDAGTIVDSQDVIAIEVKESDVEGLFQDEINARNLDPTKPMIALTYDDGPDGINSNRILNVYEKYGTVATFFELGQNVENVKGSSDILKRMIDLNCEIGSHSYSHPNLYTLSSAQVKEQADLTKKAIKDACGQEPTVYRPPYGNGNEEITKLFGVPGILWSIDTLDWSYKDAGKIIASVKSNPSLDGKVVLMHSLYDFTAEATEELVPWLIKEGYQLVTVSEMLMYKYNEDPSQVKYYGYNAFYLEN